MGASMTAAMVTFMGPTMVASLTACGRVYAQAYNHIHGLRPWACPVRVRGRSWTSPVMDAFVDGPTIAFTIASMNAFMNADIDAVMDAPMTGRIHDRSQTRPMYNTSMRTPSWMRSWTCP